MTEALPLPITSLIPVVAFPLFGIMDTGDVCMAYMKVSNFISNLVVHTKFYALLFATFW